MTQVDILGPRERRRIWGAREKAALLAEIDAEGGKVRLVARRHGISESLLYNWRSARKAAAVAMGAAENVEFIAVGVVEGKPPRGPASLAPPPRTATGDRGRTGQSRVHRNSPAERRPDQRRCVGQRESTVAGASCREGVDVISPAPGTKVFLG